MAWYGQLAGTPTPLKPKNPLDLVGELDAPVLGLYGGKDTGITQEQVEKMKATLSTSSDPDAKASKLVVYPESGHAFMRITAPAIVKPMPRMVGKMPGLAPAARRGLTRHG